MSAGTAFRGAALVVLMTWLPVAAEAALRAAVEPSVIDELDTAHLIIRVIGGSQAQRLDLTPLEKDFEVLTTRSATQYRSTNGQVESWVEYQVLLRPKRTGKLTIPSIDIGADSTRPLTIEVRGMDPQVKRAIEHMVFFETEVTENPVYVQAETVLVRRLYYASGAQIYSDLPGMPDIPNAVVLALGEPASSTTVRNGERYGVIEQRFAIFPEQSGELTIPSISITSSVRVQSDGRSRRTGVRIGTHPVTLDVRPIPAAYPKDAPWLPARNVTVSDRWSPPDSPVGVGDPLRRTVAVRVEGNVSSAIPPLTPALPESNFKSYPEPPDLKDDTSGGTVQGRRQQTYSIIPTAPGDLTVPATEVVWWDVNADRVRTARAPARSVAIVGAPTRSASGQPPAQAGPVSAPRPPADDRTDVRERPNAGDHRTGPRAAAGEPSRPPRSLRSWFSDAATTLRLAAALIVAALIVAALIVRRRRGAPRPEARPASRSACWRDLKRACRRGDSTAIHRALLRYLRTHYDAPMAEAVQRFRDEGQGATLDAVNASLYRPGDGQRVDRTRVLDSVRAIRRRHAAPETALPALYD